MALIVVFLLLLMLLFVALLYFLEPTSIEKAVDEQLANIEPSPTASRVTTNIPRQEGVH